MPLEGSEGGPPQMLSANHINRPGKDPDKKSLASIRVIRGQLFFFSYPCHPRNPRLPAYSRARAALNVPCFEGRSPTSGANSTSPLIESGVSNFPLNINVPASRPTLPSINSTGPVNVTEFPSFKVHFASQGLPGPQTFNRGSTTSKVPFPASCASKRTVRLFPSAKLISMFQRPIMFGDCV